MKIAAMVFVLSMFTTTAFSETKMIVGYDHYLEPNINNNYDNAWGFTLGVEHDIYGNLKGQAKYIHMTDIDFPSVDDPKGSWGELRGNIAFYGLKYDLPYNDHLGFYLTSGAGIGFWDFRENPFLQDADTKVSLENSIVFHIGAGANLNIGHGWDVFIESGWFDTNIPKEISKNGRGIENILDSGDIGLQYIPLKVCIKKRF